jgi:hypothetical protein
MGNTSTKKKDKGRISSQMCADMKIDGRSFAALARTTATLGRGTMKELFHRDVRDGHG